MTLSHEVLQDGSVRITIVGDLPSPTIAENAKWKWVPWNVNYQKQQLEKDGARVLQSLSNLNLVEGTVSARAAVREQEKATKALAASAAASQQQPAQTVVAEVPTPASAPTPEARPAKKSRKGRS